MDWHLHFTEKETEAQRASALPIISLIVPCYEDTSYNESEPTLMTSSSVDFCKELFLKEGSSGNGKRHRYLSQALLPEDLDAGPILELPEDLDAGLILELPEDRDAGLILELHAEDDLAGQQFGDAGQLSAHHGFQPHCIDTTGSSAYSIAQKAGTIVRCVVAEGDLGIVQKTSATDLQTKADHLVQMSTCSSLAQKFPKLTIIGEEDLPPGEVDQELIEDGQWEEILK
ncbi:hypothetical protein STEG23_020234 [Scotinomys teguina]